MSHKTNIVYDKVGETNVVILSIPIHYPGEYLHGDEHDPKKRLAVLKRALQRIRQEIVIADTRIEMDEIKKSGQIDLESQINEQVQHVRNKNGYE